MRRISVCFLTLGMLGALKFGVGVLADPIKDKTPQLEAKHDTQSANLATNAQLKDAQEDERDEGKRPEEMMNVEYSVADLVVSFANRAPGKGTAKAVLAADFEPLINTLRIVNPESWEVAGGAASVVISRRKLGLVIRQTQAAHEEIAALLGQLRRVSDLTVSLKLKLLETFQDRWPRYGYSGSGFRDEILLSGNEIDETGLVAKGAVAKTLLDQINRREGTRVIAVPKLTLCNGQTSDLIYETHVADDPVAVSIGFKISATISANRQTMRLRIAAPVSDVNQVLESSISISLRNRETIVCDVARLLEIYHGAERTALRPRDAPSAAEINEAMKSYAPCTRRFLVVTPQILIVEKEEEELLGVDLPERDAR